MFGINSIREFSSVIISLVVIFQFAWIDLLESSEVRIGNEIIASSELVDAASKEGAVSLYTAMGAVETVQSVKAFEKRFPGVKVGVERQPGGRLYTKLLVEARAGKTLADVIYQTDIALMEKHFEQGLLDHFVPAQDKLWPEEYKRTGYWYAAAQCLMYIIYNTDQVSSDKAPRGWNDLLDSRWQGKIGMGHGGLGGTTWTCIMFQRKVLGLEYWKRLAAQKPIIYTGGSLITDAGIRGEVQVAININTLDYTARVKQKAPVAAVYPLEGIPSPLYPIGVSAKPPHPNAAQLFMNWWLSQEGQRVQSEAKGNYSVRPDVPTPLGIQPRNMLKIWVPNLKEYITLRDEWVGEWNKIYGYRP
jgi:iron(III) transport system substrate-binding protein